jgi:hypothetical protein
MSIKRSKIHLSLNKMGYVGTHTILIVFFFIFMNECYSHKPNTYCYREATYNILSTVHVRIKSTLNRSWYFRINYHSFSNSIAFTYIIQDKSQTFKKQSLSTNVNENFRVGTYVSRYFLPQQ